MSNIDIIRQGVRLTESSKGDQENDEQHDRGSAQRQANGAGRSGYHGGRVSPLGNDVDAGNNPSNSLDLPANARRGRVGMLGCQAEYFVM